MERQNDSELLKHEFLLLRILVEAFSQHGILVIITVDDESDHRPETKGSDPRSPIDNLSAACDVIQLSRNHVIEVIATGLAGKTSAQEKEIRRILDRLRQKLTHLGPKAEPFSDLYPIHPH